MLFVRDGVPPTRICDSAKEMIQSTFYQKIKDATCHLKQLEPNAPWSNPAKRKITELKKGAVCKLLRSRVLKHLWDDCLEEPNTPWSNDAKRKTKELKKGAVCKLLRSRVPKHLWDDCLDLEIILGQILLMRS